MCNRNGSRVHRIVTADDVEHQRRVGDRVGEWPDLVEAAGERDQAVAADVAVGRLHADDSAQRGGLADRAARVAAEPDRGEPGGNRGGTTTAAPTRHT